MQKALKEDEELVVLFHSGAEKIRVLEIFVPSWQVAVLKGLDADRNQVARGFASGRAATDLQGGQSAARRQAGARGPDRAQALRFAIGAPGVIL